MRVKVTILLSIQYVAKETILKIGNKDHRKIELSQKCQANIEIWYVFLRLEALKDLPFLEQVLSDALIKNVCTSECIGI